MCIRIHVRVFEVYSPNNISINTLDQIRVLVNEEGTIIQE